jgi:hypothetical protein
MVRQNSYDQLLGAERCPEQQRRCARRREQAHAIYDNTQSARFGRPCGRGPPSLIGPLPAVTNAAAYADCPATRTRRVANAWYGRHKSPRRRYPG